MNQDSLEQTHEKDTSCKTCGSDCMWQDCWSCGGEGFRDDLYESDPLWYEPGDTETCDICAGKGGYYICLDAKNCK